MPPRVSIHRRAQRTTRALTAASQRVLSPDSFKRSISGGLTASADDWQTKAWEYYKLVGELRYYISWRSASLSRCRLVASELDLEGTPTGRIAEDNPEGVQVRDIVKAFGNGVIGHSKILARIALLLGVPGECWVVMVVRTPAADEDAEDILAQLRAVGQSEEWHVLSRKQIRTSGRDITLLLRDGSKHTFNPQRDLMFRIWDENPEDPKLPTSAVWGNLSSLNEIVRSDATIDNASKSRLIGNGLLFTPQEMSLPSQKSPEAVPEGAMSSVPVPGYDGATSQDLQDLIYDVATTAMKEPDSLAALLPIIVGVPGEQIKNVEWLRPASDVPETALKTRDAAIRRLAMGLDVAPERLLGMGESGNHWSAWLLDEVDIKTHIAPILELIVETLTTEVLKPMLVEAGINPNKYVIWYDTTALTQDPDMGDEAVEAHDRGAISSRALREHLGFDDQDGYDLETREGWLQLAFDKVQADPALLSTFAPLIQQMMPSITVPVPPEQLPAAPTPETIDEADSEPDEPDDEEEEAQPPASVNAAAFTVVRMCASRALELAGKRRHTRSNHAKLANVPVLETHLNLEPVPASEVSSLIKGWDVGVSDPDLASVGFDPSRFRGLVESSVGVALMMSRQWELRPADVSRAMGAI